MDGTAKRAAALAWTLWSLCTITLAQSPHLPVPNPVASDESQVEAAETPATPDEAIALEERVKQLEELVRQMAGARSEREVMLESRVQELESRLNAQRAPPGNAVSAGSAPASSPRSIQEENLTRGGAGGVSPTDPGDKADMPAPIPDIPLRAKFGPGFQVSDANDEFVLQFHNLTQVDGRYELQNGDSQVIDTFGLPRQWWIFNGRMTKPFEYYLAINEGFDNLNLLDAYLNVHYVDWLQFKVGRYRTPFTYEFYAVSASGLVTPERSQFFNNFALNRNVGIMLWGQLLDKRIDYAAGLFNGNRNGYLDFDNSKDLAAFINFLPFLKSNVTALRHFNIGGSVNAGDEFEATNPRRLRLNIPTQGSSLLGIPFLQFVDGTLESGSRAYWSLHAAWYYQQLSLIAEWQSGFEYLAPAANPVAGRTKLPTQSYYVTVGYFLTGETVESRGVVKPHRDFDLRRGKRGPGAIELATRFNYLYVGDQVFTAGFADPNLWTNQVSTLDIGVNWYWNQYIKTYFGWQHAAFGDPVLFSADPDVFHTASDMLWFRFQVSF